MSHQTIAIIAALMLDTVTAADIPDFEEKLANGTDDRWVKGGAR